MKKLLILLMFIPSITFGATITRYVNTAATPGGDGISNTATNDGNGHRAYASLSEWEDAEDGAVNGDLTDGEGDIMLVYCSGTAADPNVVYIDGWTTSESCYIDIRGDNTAGKWNTNAYRIACPDNVYELFFITESYVRLTNIQMQSNSGGYNTLAFSNWEANPINMSDRRITNCIIRGTESSGRSVGNGGGKTTYINCLFEYTHLSNDDATASTILYNCTSIGGTVQIGNGFLTAVNHISTGYAWEDYYRSGGTMSLNYCSSSDATADDYGGDGNLINQTYSFVDTTTGDYRIGASATGALNNGMALSQYFTTDITGNTRTGSWDRGMYEYQPIVRYVNTTSTTGGDGTTNETTGDHRAYPSLSAWETAEDFDLTASGGNIMTVYCSGATPETQKTTIDGWTTNASCYILVIGDWIMPASGDCWDTTKYRFDTTTQCVDVYEDFVTLQNLQLSSSYSGGGWITPGGTSNFLIKDCIFKGKPDVASDYWAIFTNADSSTNTVVNCLFYDFPTANTSMRMFWTNSGNHTFKFYNCTFVGSYYVFRAISYLTITNCIIQGAIDGVLGSQSVGNNNVSNCSGDFLTSDSHNSVTVDFVDAANDDYHLKTTDIYAKDGGLTDPLVGLYLSDIDGDTRGELWDIGVDEYVATTPNILEFKPLKGKLRLRGKAGIN